MIDRKFITSKSVALMTWAMVSAFALPAMPVEALAFEIKPYKERLFKYRKPLAIEDNGDFLRLPYDPLRDINKRDVQPVRRVHGKYLSSAVKKHQVDTSITQNGRTVTHFAVGALGGTSNMTVIFLHGKDGTRHLGFRDEIFGGNFNRLKNLMYKNQGIYISSDFTDYKEDGRKDIEALAAYYRPKTNGKLVVACGSMGSFLCWRLMKKPASAKLIDAYVIMGGFPDPQFLENGNFVMPAGKPPIYFAHGSIDHVYDWKDAYRYYKKLKAADPVYPAKMALFDGGKHGTPIRMIDWRVALNWIAKQ